MISDFLSPQVATLLVGFGGIFVAFAKWLSFRFQYVEDLARRVEENTTTMLDNHESHDQSRHEENLYRFEKISVALAKLGSSNGTH